MALRKLTQYEVLSPFLPPVAAIPARDFCLPKFPIPSGSAVPPGGPNPGPNNSGPPPPCPVTILVPPCRPSDSAVVGTPEVCTPRTINC